MRTADRAALQAWAMSRVAVGVAAAAGAWLLVGGSAGSVTGFVSRWDRWDTGLFVKIARYGYSGYPAHYPDQGVVAFFPGEPLLLRAVHLVVRNWVASGLVISLVASAVALVALSRLAVLEGLGPAGAERAVWALVLSPYAVFLAAAYSESLFLALALPAWIAARRGRWAWAGGLATLALLTRVTGVYLAVALVVEYAVTRRGRIRPDAAWLALPFAALAGWVGYLHHITGDWLAWPHAQAANWHRGLTAPWTALHTTWSAAFDAGEPAGFAWSFRAEILAMAIGVALTLWLVWRRRWAESLYVGAQVISFGVSEFYLSVARAGLLWWPLWLGLAAAAGRRPWLARAYLAVAPALMAVEVVTFTSGHWVG